MAKVPQAAPFKTAPLGHQLDFLNKHGRKPYVMMNGEMGTGKTWMAIVNAAQIWGSGDCDGLLVFAPNGVHTNWVERELPKHMPDWVRYRAAAWYASPNKEERSALDNLLGGDRGQLRIFVMNWEAIQTKKGKEAAIGFARLFTKLMIICDESDAFKNPKTVRWGVLDDLRKLSKWRRTMTGTPINNSPFDLFTQYSFLSPNILKTDSFWAFKSEYGVMLNPGHPLYDHIQKQRAEKSPNGRVGQLQLQARCADGRPQYRNLERLARLIEPYTYRVLKKDCLDLPDKIYKTIYFDLSPEQKMAYELARKECRMLFQGEATAFTKLVSLTKLAQITSGYYLHPESEEPVRINKPGESPKLKALCGLVERIVAAGEKLIIWARYAVEIQDIKKVLGDQEVKYVEYHGKVKKADRTAAIESFERGDAQVFVGNQQAGGTGITLIAASNVIYFSNSFSLRDRLQSEDRAHRIGQTKSVNYWNIVGKKTIDQHVVNSLEGKKDIAEYVMSMTAEDL